MEILENRPQWEAAFKAGWLNHLETEGSPDWSKYNRAKNTTAPSGNALTLAESNLILISSGGFYLKESQDPFKDVEGDSFYGDYSIRTFSPEAVPDSLAIAHTHYNHSAFHEDYEALLPIKHLKAMVSENIIGGLADTIISFMGYQPFVNHLLDETIPAIIKVVKQTSARGALLVPAWPICSQSVGLIARALEMEGIATTLTSWNLGFTKPTMPPRATYTRLPRGTTVGMPHDKAQQRRILDATLALLEQNAPTEAVKLDEREPNQGA